jgi:hypothetical protein
MTLVMLRERTLRPPALGRALLLLAFAGAVIIGLLAMHTISPTSGHHAPAHTAMTADSAPPSTADAATPGDDCDGLCPPPHSMTTMACVLALLATVIVLIGAANRSPISIRFHAIAVSAVRARVLLSFRSLPPPDLHLLSISRT